MAQAGRSSLPSSSSSSSAPSLLLGLSQKREGSRTAQYSFSNAVLVSQGGGSRVLSYCEPLSCLLASQPSPHATLVPGETSFFRLTHSQRGLKRAALFSPSVSPAL